MALDLVLTAVFVLLLVIVFRTLDAWPLFEGSGPFSRLLFAAAFAGLCIFSLRPRATEPSAKPTTNAWLDFVLLPYEALVITLLALPIVLLVVWLWERTTRRRRFLAKKEDA